MKKKFNSDILIIIIILALIALMSLLNESGQIAGQAGFLGEECDSDNTCEGDLICMEGFCVAPQSQPPVSERIANVIIS